MTETGWETVEPSAFCWEQTHLFRYEPDPVNGGAWLKDSEGNNWALRTCALCGERQRIRANQMEMVAA